MLGWWCSMGFFFPPKSRNKTLPLTGGSQPNQAAIKTVDKRCVRSCSEATIHTGSYNLSILVAGWERGVKSVFLFFFSSFRVTFRPSQSFLFHQLYWERDGAQAHTQILPVWCTAPHCSIRLIPIGGSSAGRKIERGNRAIKKQNNTKTFVCGSRDLETGKVGGQSTASMLPCCNISLRLYMIQTSTMRLSHHIWQ